MLFHLKLDSKICSLGYDCSKVNTETDIHRPETEQ